MRHLARIRRTDQKLKVGIPQDKVKRDKWIAAMRRDPPYPKDENFAICSIHFSEDCFEVDFNAIRRGT